MSFLKKIFTIGNRALARTLAKEMAELYIHIKKESSENSKNEILRKTLSQLDSRAAEKLLSDESFWTDDEDPDLSTVIYLMVVESSPRNKKKLSVPQSNIDAYLEEIQGVLDKYGLSNE